MTCKAGNCPNEVSAVGETLGPGPILCHVHRFEKWKESSTPLNWNRIVMGLVIDAMNEITKKAFSGPPLVNIE